VKAGEQLTIKVGVYWKRIGSFADRSHSMRNSGDTRIDSNNKTLIGGLL